MTSQHQWSWTLLRAGAFRLDGGSMFGVVPKSLWSRLTQPDDANRITLQTNCLLLDDGTHRVLIETGYGNKWDDKNRAIFHLEERCILRALHEHDLDGPDITHVIVSHLHFDHAGGLTHLDVNGRAVSSFPNATIFTQQTEWDDALANKSTMTKTYLRSHLDPVAEQITCVDGETDVLPGITVWPMPGHTWGQQAVRFADEHGVLCFPGDVMPTANHLGSAFNMGYDMLPYTNMQSKGDLLSVAADDGWRIVIDHEPGDPVVHVQRDTDKMPWFKLLPAGDQAPVR
jgi:glyoxylase-like metal-dependent hydrolase (beta-lactamase superfamily II)